MKSIDEKKTIYIELLISFLILLTTIWIWTEANSISNNQNKISEKQTNILLKQTEILANQTNIQKNQYIFDKEKSWSEVANKNRDDMNNLYDKITYSDQTLVNVNRKIINWERIENKENLNRYVNEFENIGSLYCDSKIRKTDLEFILKKTFENVCWSEQINSNYKNLRSWISWICYTLFPKSTWMALYKNINKCPILKN